MFNSRYLTCFVAISLAAVFALPIYIYFSLTPQFGELIIKNTEREAQRVSRHIISMFIPAEDALHKQTIRDLLRNNDKKLREEFHLKKLKLFLPSGEVLFSSEEKDIGKINSRSYFTEVVARGEIFSKVVKKNEESLEGQEMAVDVVEIYVPIMRDGNFIGAFEIYYDITESKQKLDMLLYQVHLAIFIISTVLLIAIVFSTYKANAHIAAQKRTELEREKLIIELQSALDEIKTLQGIIPICSYCKQIRDDEGYWNKIEEYIQDRSGAQFSHGICPDCIKKHHPKLGKNKEKKNE